MRRRGTATNGLRFLVARGSLALRSADPGATSGRPPRPAPLERPRPARQARNALQLALALGLAACRPAAEAPDSLAQQGRALQATNAAAERLADLIAEVRGLPLERLPPLRLLDSDGPAAEEMAHTPPAPPAEPPPGATFADALPLPLLLGFSAVPAWAVEDASTEEQTSLPPDPRAAYDAMLGAGQPPAYYDLQAKAITVSGALRFPDGASLELSLRRRLAASRPDNETLERLGLGAAGRLLLHELVHAAQDQRYEIDALRRRPTTLDGQLALLFVLEGDATLVTWDIAHRALGIDLLALPGAHKTLRQLGVEQLFGGDAVWPVLRELSALPYYDGAGFVAALVRSGGYELLDEVYARPPSSTAEVLHPELYAGGFVPTELLLPPLAAAYGGLAAGEQGVLGEARLRALLVAWGGERCAAEAASLWRGDRYLLLERAGDRAMRGALLAIATASPAHTAALVACLQAAPDTPALQWLEEPDRITLAVGLDSATYRVAELLAQISAGTTLVTPPPVAGLPWPLVGEPSALDSARRFAVDTGGVGGHVADGWYVHPGLGLRLPVPEGWEAQTEHEQAAMIPLVLRRPADAAVITLIVLGNERRASLLAIAGETMAAFTAQYTEIELRAEETRPSGCGEAYRAVFDHQALGDQRVGLLAIVLGDGIVLTMVMTAAAQQGASALAAVDDLLARMACGPERLSAAGRRP